MRNSKPHAFLALCAFAASTVIASAVAAEPAPILEKLAFLEGHWRGGDAFVFEETWSAAEAGVMTGMARGVSGGKLAVLEYIVVSEEEGGVIMRFKHYNRDFSTWEKEGPVSLALTSAGDRDVTFTADPPSETVKSVRYWMPDAETLQADVALVEESGDRSFSLSFKRAGK